MSQLGFFLAIGLPIVLAILAFFAWAMLFRHDEDDDRREVVTEDRKPAARPQFVTWDQNGKWSRR